MKKVIKINVKALESLQIIVMGSENESTSVENQEVIAQVTELPLPDIRFNGTKIDFIRILYALCSLDAFVDSKGKRVSDSLVFETFGVVLGMDLSHYCNELNRTKQENTSMETQTAIFRKMEEIFRKHFEID